MGLLKQIGYYRRIKSGMLQYCQKSVMPDSKNRIRQTLERRESIWLNTLRRTIFSNRSNPYHIMFNLAGYGYDDLAERVRRNRLEGTLRELRHARVYLDHDEFKGIKPIIRYGQEIISTPEHFSNPLVTGWFQGNSGGSRSAGTLTCTGTEQLVHLTGYASLHAEEFELDGIPYVIARPGLPSIAGLLFCLLYSRLGSDVGPWFTFGGEVSNSIHYLLLTNYIVALARWRGFPAPFPENLPANDFTPVARWISKLPRRERRCALQVVASTGVRIATAALEKDLDISGTLVFSGGEALTEGKRRTIESTGAKVFPAYWISELGQIGHSCKNMNSGNCIHLFSDSNAVISEIRKDPLSQSDVNSLLFTTLLPHAPYILVNVEMQDAGVLEEGPCDCVFGKVGFTRRIRGIYSYVKLSGQGMTLVGTDIVHILEVDLPKKFGGAPGDYQLIEQEGKHQTELVLHISPRTGVKSPEIVKHHMLQLLRKYNGGALAWRVWKYSDAMKAVIAEPLITKAGKLLPLHLNNK